MLILFNGNFVGNLHLYNINLRPDVFDVGDIKVTKVDNKRYTRQDIGKLDSRVKRLEYYTSLSLNFDELTASGVFTFGLNKINLLFPRSDFRPSVIVAVNPHVIEQATSFYNTTNIPLFLDSAGKKLVSFNKNVHFLHSAGSGGNFAEDCSISIRQGSTVTYVAMQLAFHMGFKEVALVGCDHSFVAKGPAYKTVLADKVDSDHFDPNYFAGGVKWDLPSIAASTFHYDVAKDVFESHGREIVNCTEGGKLEVFPRQSLSEFLRKDAG